MATKRKQITVSDRHQEMLDELIEHTGAVNETEVFRNALVLYYSKELGSYTAIQKKRLDQKPEPADRTARRRQQKEQDKKDAEAYGQSICEQLDGASYKEGSSMICRWKTYDLVNAKHVIVGEREVPFEQLNDDHVEEQYQNGTKEEVEQAIKNGAEVE